LSPAEHFAQIADSLGSLRAVTEDRFLKIGRSLEAAVGILERLTTRFDGLLNELRGPSLAQARQDLTAAACQIAALAAVQQHETSTLAGLADAVGSLDGRLAAMRATLHEIDMLAMNARLVAAGIGTAGAGFLPFSHEIRRSAAAARVTVQQLAQELATAGEHLQAARAGTDEFTRLHAAELQSIPAHLTASASAMEGHSHRAASTAAAVSACSGDIGRHVAETIVALQFGDITRQRIEHMQNACRILAELPETAAQTAAAQGIGGRLVATQLRDTAEALDRDAEHVARQLQALVEAAHQVAERGRQTYGASDRGHGSFLGDLETEVRAAQALFGGLHAAHAEVDRRIATVSQGAQRLTRHMAALRDMEAGIHIIGLNTTLKCDRLGPVGRPLSVIAQALRHCGGRTAADAASILATLQPVLAAADALTAGGDTRGGADAGGVGDRMVAAVGQLADTGQRLTDALAGLEGDSDAVNGLLAAAMECFTVRHEISAVLREAAAACGTPAVEPGAAEAAGGAAEVPVLALIAAGYTMARERSVHARFALPPGDAVVDDRLRAGDPAAAAEPDLADMLF
jgi:hypothetical protein